VVFVENFPNQILPLSQQNISALNIEVNMTFANTLGKPIKLGFGIT